MKNSSNQYNSEKHDKPLVCPRSNCNARNAPQDSEEFRPNCWKCSEYLGVQEAEVGDVYTVDVTDIHESGAGVGHTESGFVLLINGVLPEKKVKARVTQVQQSFAWAEEVETVAESLEDEEDEETEDEEDTVNLGSREDHWGR